MDNTLNPPVLPGQGEDGSQAPTGTGAEPPRNAPVGGGPQRFAHYGRGAELFAITLVNLVLKVFTLGLYHFWGKTRVRRYVWSHTHFAGEAFEYTGRGIELFLGYLIVMAVLVPVGAGFQFLPALGQEWPWLPALASVVIYPVMIFLMGFALYASRRYMLSRTRWRSIRFGLSGSARRYGLKTLLYSLVTFVTFGLYFPFMRNHLTREMIDTLWFGDRYLRYDGRGRDLFKRFMLLWVAALALVGGLIGFSVFLAVIGNITAAVDPEVMPVVFGALGVLFWVGFSVIWLWYKIGEYRYILVHTSIDGVRLRMNAGTSALVWLGLGNLLLLFGTLGLGYAWVVVRTARFLARSVALEGELALDSIAQHPAGVPRIGEGLAEAFDLGSGI